MCSGSQGSNRRLHLLPAVVWLFREVEPLSRGNGTLFYKRKHGGDDAQPFRPHAVNERLQKRYQPLHVRTERSGFRRVAVGHKRK